MPPTNGLQATRMKLRARTRALWGEVAQRMIKVADLRKLVRARLKDAKSLLSERRFDGAIYIGGYVVEIALKARICRTLKWTEFPETRKEFESLTTFADV